MTPKRIIRGLLLLGLGLVVAAFTAGGGGLSSPLSSGTGIYAGGSTANGVIPGVLYSSVAAVGNSGGSLTTLMSYTLPANVFNTTGRVLRITLILTVATNANAKTVDAFFGASSTNIMSADTTSNATFTQVLYAVRTGSNTQDVYRIGGNSAGPTFMMPNRLTGTETDTADIVIKVTATGVATNDIVQRLMLVEVLN